MLWGLMLESKYMLDDSRYSDKIFKSLHISYNSIICRWALDSHACSDKFPYGEDVQADVML